MTTCNCPKTWTQDSPPRLERYALSFNCETHARREQTDVIAELHAEIERLKAQLKERNDER